MNEVIHDEIGSAVQQLGRKAGVGIHISSLPGAHGIGDIADSALSFLDTLIEMDIGVWQFLPTGPTAYGDSPYQPLSAFAGNAMLIGMRPLVQLGLLDADDLSPLQNLPRDFVDYGRLIPAKRALLAKSAERFANRSVNGLRADYEDFLHLHDANWLDDYALFRVLKSLHGERPWPEWEKGFVRRDPAALEKVKNEQRVAIEHGRIKQFLFWRQWQHLRAEAAGKGICLFGDMPIYISLDSSDAWSHPEMLLIDQDGRPSEVAGVPPDYFSADGQLWGNPLYDWSHHERTGFQWWVERMKHAASLSDVVRIDHFRGFESFWSVPFGCETAREGEWVPGPGDRLFEKLEQALDRLPIVAEDLGVITPEVDKLRLDHGMPGMVVLQFEIGDPEFDIGALDQNSVCYTGTHDNDTTVGWFLGTGEDTRTEKEVLETRKLALEVTEGSADTIHMDMIRLAYSSLATLAVAPMQDYLGLGSEARLNIPGTTLNNWRWRMQEGELNAALIESVNNEVQAASRGR
ncbi:MAG: 4-alpha-glucanotransferase [Xanthomonadales bacterium]|nr:4-alpha-glucanotransferase [Xanthomonadales bacterium]